MQGDARIEHLGVRFGNIISMTSMEVGSYAWTSRNCTTGGIQMILLGQLRTGSTAADDRKAVRT